MNLYNYCQWGVIIAAVLPLNCLFLSSSKLAKYDELYDINNISQLWPIKCKTFNILKTDFFGWFAFHPHCVQPVTCSAQRCVELGCFHPHIIYSSQSSQQRFRSEITFCSWTLQKANVCKGFAFYDAKKPKCISSIQSFRYLTKFKYK